MKIKYFGFFNDRDRCMPRHIKQSTSIDKTPVSISETGFYFANKRSSKKAQSVLEYFVLFTTMALLCLISVSTMFGRARRAAWDYYNDKISGLDLTAQDTVAPPRYEF